MPSQIRGLRRKAIRREKVTTDVGVDVDVNVRVSENIASDTLTTTEFTVGDSTAPTGDTGTLSTLFGWLANMLKAITGKSNWRTAPARTLEQCVDTAGLTADTVPVASAGNTLANSRITRNGLLGMIEVPFVTGDSTPALFVGGATSDKTAISATSNSGVGLSASSTSNYGVNTLSQTGTALNATAGGSNATMTVDNTSTGSVATFTRNVSGANTNAVVTIGQSHASATATALRVTQAGNGISVDIAPTGTGSNAIGLRTILPSGNHAEALWAQTPGNGKAIYALATGAGQAIWAQNTSSGIANMGYNTGSGYAGYFESARSGGGSVPTMEIYTNHTSDTQSTLLLRSKGQGTGLQILFTANSMAGDMASLTHTGTSFTGNGYRVTLTSSGHGVKSLQQGTGKSGEFVISNASSTNVALDTATNGSGIALKTKTTGAGRSAYFESDRSSATDPTVEIVVTNTSDAGVGLRINGKGTGSMLEVQDNGTNVLEVQDGSKVGLYGVAPVARAAALTASTGTLPNAVTRIAEIEAALQAIGIIN